MTDAAGLAPAAVARRRWVVRRQSCSRRANCLNGARGRRQEVNRLLAGRESGDPFDGHARVEVLRALFAAGAANAQRATSSVTSGGTNSVFRELSHCAADRIRSGTFATLFLRDVPDLYLLAKVLGHSHERTTKTYAHLLPDHLAKSLNAVNLTPAVGPAALEAKRRWARVVGSRNET